MCKGVKDLLINENILPKKLKLRMKTKVEKKVLCKSINNLNKVIDSIVSLNILKKNGRYCFKFLNIRLYYKTKYIHGKILKYKLKIIIKIINI